MDKTNNVENRVLLFEALGRAFVERSAEELRSKDPERRCRVLRALADLAFVSCAVADSAGQTAGAVRRRVARAAEPTVPAVRGAPELGAVADEVHDAELDDEAVDDFDEREMGGGD